MIDLYLDEQGFFIADYTDNWSENIEHMPFDKDGISKSIVASSEYCDSFGSSLQIELPIEIEKISIQVETRSPTKIEQANVFCGGSFCSQNGKISVISFLEWYEPIITVDSALGILEVALSTNDVKGSYTLFLWKNGLEYKAYTSKQLSIPPKDKVQLDKQNYIILDPKLIIRDGYPMGSIDSDEIESAEIGQFCSVMLSSEQNLDEPFLEMMVLVDKRKDGWLLATQSSEVLPSEFSIVVEPSNIFQIEGKFFMLSKEELTELKQLVEKQS